MEPEGTTKFTARVLAILKKARIIVISCVIGVGIGVFTGILLARASFVNDGLISLAVGLSAYAGGHVIERAYRYWRVPRDVEQWAAKYEEIGFETIRSGIHFAQCQMVMAEMIERSPKQFEDILMLTSQMGYVMHREALANAERAGLIPAICWDEKRAIYGAPTMAVRCDGYVEPQAQVIDMTTLIPPSSSSESSEVHVPRLLPLRSSSEVSVPVMNSPTMSASRSKFTVRGGKLVPR